MPDLVDDFGDAEGGAPRQKFFTRVAHLAPWVVVLGVTISVVSDIGPDVMQWPSALSV